MIVFKAFIWFLVPLLITSSPLTVREESHTLNGSPALGLDTPQQGVYHYEITQMTSVFYPKESNPQPSSASMLSFLITSYNNDIEAWSSLCQLSWIPPSYPRAWIECSSNHDLLFRFVDTPSSPKSQFIIEFLEVQYFSRRTSGFTIRNLAVFVSNEHGVNTDLQLVCTATAVGKPTTCTMNSIAGVVQLVPRSRSISLAQGFSLHNIIITNRTVPVGETLCQMKFEFIDYATSYLPPVPATIGWDTSAGADRVTVTCTGTWICSSRFAGEPNLSFGFDSAACDSSNLKVQLRSSVPGIDDIRVQLTRKWPLMIDPLFRGPLDSRDLNAPDGSSIPVEIMIGGEAHLVLGSNLKYVANGTNGWANTIPAPLNVVNVTSASRFCGSLPSTGCPFPYSASDHCWEVSPGLYYCGPLF